MSAAIFFLFSWNFLATEFGLPKFENKKQQRFQPFFIFIKPPMFFASTFS